MDDQQAEKFYSIVNQVAEVLGKPELEAEIEAWLSDETDADDVDALAYNFRKCIEDKIADGLTDEDIAAWHAGELSDNASALVARYGAFQVWGSRTGSEPLSIRWSE